MMDPDNTPTTPIQHQNVTDDAPPSAVAVDAPDVPRIPYDVEQIKADMKECSEFVWDVQEVRGIQSDVIAARFDPNRPNASRTLSVLLEPCIVGLL